MKYLMSVLLIILFGLDLYADEIVSPDLNLHVLFSIDQGSFVYQVRYKDTMILSESNAGIRLRKEQGDNGFITDLQLSPAKPSGERLFNEYIFSVSCGKDQYEIIFRVYNQGIAFRYKLDQRSFVFRGENTTFQMTDGTQLWFQPDIFVYEGLYHNTFIDQVEVGELAGLPVTFKVHSLYATITESCLINYSGMSLQYAGGRKWKSNFACKDPNGDIIQDRWCSSGSLLSPWRIIMVSEDLNGLFNSPIVRDTCTTPLAIREKPEWIKPGKCVWSWLNGDEVTLENMKRYSELASKIGFEYNLIDEGWQSWQKQNKGCWDLLKEVTDDANYLNVGIWVWKACDDRNEISGIRDKGKRRAFFDSCKKYGVVGVKIDFLNSESFYNNNFIVDVLEDALDFKLMVLFHGCGKPTGLSRIYPNLMGMEAVRGAEYKGDWAKPPTTWAVHNTTIPFTRLIAGTADFTPMTFDIYDMDKTSITHQIASAIVFSNPLLVLAADPNVLVNHPLKNIVTEIAPVWDRTEVLSISKIGELAAFARKRGDIWFLGIMNGAEPKELSVSLGFLEEDLNYDAKLLFDVPGESLSSEVKSQTLRRTNDLKMKISAGGGFVGVFHPEKKRKK